MEKFKIMGYWEGMRVPGQQLNLNTTVEVKVEKFVCDCLTIMSEHASMSKNEIVNTALRRFIATHKDYFPENSVKRSFNKKKSK